MAAVEDDDNVGVVGGDFGDQFGELFVGQVPNAVAAAVVADEGFIEAIGLQVPKFFGSVFLGTVACVEEEGDVIGASLAKVVAEAINDGLAGGLLVEEDF